MANKITHTAYFLRRAKRLFRKFKTLENTVLELEDKLLIYPAMGSPIGQNSYKIRISDKSKRRGKSG